MASLEQMLFLWVDDCEARKPGLSVRSPGYDPHQVVRVLQESSVRGREASEAVVSLFGRYGDLQ